MNSELRTIHDFLMRIEVKGENTILLAESLVRLRQVIGQMESESAQSVQTETVEVNENEHRIS